ncbi:hypothetical protein GCM10025857_06690 [Alicyclobacillus contaminans]|uniref:hypothetical protein n=1 Tax=Alicyclobacillus contaminans TaxID=392016 RepID=UPI00047ACE65|nr:hypothetical protein [Alicyclobacillus contaminans]GMA49312.1 hypothetical protein GCM10025857_06690 [Alicyclobacillus contaminans]
MEQWAKTFQLQGQDVQSITVELVITNCTGDIWVTDIMFQGGSVATTWVGHPAEIRWSFDNV